MTHGSPPAATDDGRPASAETSAMFDGIAPVYDLMNMVMTGGLDRRWRRAAVTAAGVSAGMSALDVACGTGALTRELSCAIGSGGRVVAIDLAARMLEVARRRPLPPGRAQPEYVQADALAIPLPDESVDAASIAFGLRNVTDPAACLAEMTRCTRHGGRVVVLEIATSGDGSAARLAAVWLQRGVPLLGRLAGHPAAYRYLPASVGTYPPPESVAEMMRGAGLVSVSWRRLWPGIVTLHAGVRP